MFIGSAIYGFCATSFCCSGLLGSLCHLLFLFLAKFLSIPLFTIKINFNIVHYNSEPDNFEFVKLILLSNLKKK